MFSSRTLEKLKWMFPREIKSSDDAKDLLRSLNTGAAPISHLWENANPYLFWQAYANVGASEVGFETCLARLRYEYFNAISQYKAGPDVDSIFSAIILLTARNKRFSEQAEIVQDFARRFPRSAFSSAHVVKNALFSGEVERAEYEFRRRILSRPAGQANGEKLYWGSILQLHDLLLPQIDSLRSHAGSNPGLSRQMRTLEAYGIRGPIKQPSNDHLDAYCISLPADSQRLNFSTKIFGKLGIRLNHVVGVAGASVPLKIRRRSAQYDIGGGEYGCFASHVAVWEKIAKANTPGLVLEDDAVPAFPFTGNELRDLIPNDAEIVFVNDRCCSFVAAEFQSDLSTSTIVSDEALDWTRLSNASLLGSDGYVLTPMGAVKLLRLFDLCAMTLPLDWHLFVASRRGHYSNSVFSAERTAPLFRAVENIGPMKAYFQTLPHVVNLDFDYSAIREYN
ncbi:glycosyltransferase family 25 protein [Falsiroseomonas sp.]|uniref:glycosyltransferase family 25 protein n=1 Tax=Falsiroseomonas sp. TaxID=2870721 RepID=UPI00273734A5|nr:glycosyltransferase family 25 protein [Falsiroseomonas sp.]MDP3415087.1 glycosyltransferase family 25 protein [Falsiroseomonas sp.]